MVGQDVPSVLLAAAESHGVRLAWALAVGVVTTWLAVWVLQPVAQRLSLIDHPSSPRKDHERATPVTGGLAMVAGLLAYLAMTPAALGTPVLAFWLGAGLLIAVGVLDDIHDLRWWWRILAQVAAALVMSELGGVRVEQLGPALGLGELSLGALSTPFTVFATVGLINAVNMIDGADGIAGTLVAAAMLLLAGAGFYSGNGPMALLALGFVVVLVGFLFHNFPSPWRPRARVFMGNSGSAFLGYGLAWISFGLTQDGGHPVSPVLALWFAAIPVADCLVLIVRRLRERRSPFAAGRDHIHHMMLDAGFGPAWLSIVLAALTIMVGVVAAQALRVNVPDVLLLLLFVALCLLWLHLSSDQSRAIRLLARARRALGARHAASSGLLATAGEQRKDPH